MRFKSSCTEGSHELYNVKLDKGLGGEKANMATLDILLLVLRYSIYPPRSNHVGKNAFINGDAGHPIRVGV